MPERSGFMIGSLLIIPNTELAALVHEGLTQRGFADVPPSQRVVLQILAPAGARVTDLARQAGMTKQSMAYLVGQLEAAGYVERVEDPGDRRASLVRRTERGWAFNGAAAELVHEIEEEWTRMLGPRQMAQLKKLLGQLVTALGHEFEGGVADHSARHRGRLADRTHPPPKVRSDATFGG
ncbi:MAG: MarR family winged helix-turn-helix transcriptional regulator [Candidatus Dormibacteria bacterium]